MVTGVSPARARAYLYSDNEAHYMFVNFLARVSEKKKRTRQPKLKRKRYIHRIKLESVQPDLEISRSRGERRLGFPLAA